MAYKVRCPTCEKGVRVTDAELGGQALCPACGTRLEVPPAPLLGPQTDDSTTVELETATSITSATENDPGPESSAEAVFLDPVPAASFADGQSLLPPVVAASAGVEPATPPGLLPPLNPAPTAEEIRAVLDAQRAYPRGPHPMWWLAAGVIACAVILLSTIAFLRESDGWDQEHRTQILNYKSNAEALASAGKLQEAHEQYRQLDKIVGGREIQDPDLKRVIDTARTDQDRIYHEILASVLERGQSVPSPHNAGNIGSMKMSVPAVSVLVPGFVPTTPDIGREPSSVGHQSPAPNDSVFHPSPPATAPSMLPVHPEIVQAPSPPQPPPVPARPIPRPSQEDDQGLTDERIGQAIQSGVNYLFNQFSERRVLRSENNDPAYRCGEDSLAVYALLQCSEAISDPRLNIRSGEIKPLLDAMKEMPIEGVYETYARGIRSTALALFDRPEDFAVLKSDADWLIATCDDGAYTYKGRIMHNPPTFTDGWGVGASRGAWGDNSNSQYGLLGVWSAAEAEPRIEVPLAYWRAVERHWTNNQESNGEWGYHPGNTRLTMTSAGIASLFVTHEYLDPATGSSDPVGRDPFSPALKKGLDWFERGDHVTSQQGGYWGYRMYGIERVGLASGFKYFGRHDWYREFASEILDRQSRDGSWGDGPIDTSYALLFLARGRHPILMNKLRFNGYWANRPRDAANLARYTGKQLERPLNWQVINIKSDWTDWTDSPVLYLASHEPPKLSDDDIDRIRNFVLAGGLLFTHADAGSEAFNEFAAELAHKLFKDYELTDLPANHLIYTINFKPQPRPPLKYVTNGARVLMVHSPTDISSHWQKREDRAWEGAREEKDEPGLKARQLAPFQLGANLFVYAAGKRDLRNRLDMAWSPPPRSTPLARIKVARLQYAGNWDPEPAAWGRYANWFQRQTGYALDVAPVKLKDLKPGDATLASLTGTARTVFSTEEVAAVKAYVEAGGLLMVDMAGGTGQFDQSVGTLLLGPAFPNGLPSALPASHSALTASAPGMEDLSRPRLRPFAFERYGHSAVFPYHLTAGKGHVIATNLDLTCGLLNADEWGIIGYDPPYAQALVKNLLFWALDGQAEK